MKCKLQIYATYKIAYFGKQSHINNSNHGNYIATKLYYHYHIAKNVLLPVGRLDVPSPPLTC